MFSKLFHKLSTFGDNHQIVLAVLVTFTVVGTSWAFEKVLDEYTKNHSVRTYIIVMLAGLSLLWIIKHYILHVV